MNMLLGCILVFAMNDQNYHLTLKNISAGRYGFFETKRTLEETHDICKDNFDNAVLLEINSTQEYDAVHKFLKQQRIQANFWIADETSPASRSIGKNTIFEHGKIQ